MSKEHKAWLEIIHRIEALKKFNFSEASKEVINLEQQKKALEGEHLNAILEEIY